MKIKILIPFLLLIWFNSYAQKLTCEDFKIGIFYIPNNNKLTKYKIISKDSLSLSELITKKKPNIKKYIVVRNENTQLEWKNGLNIGKPNYEIIKWIDECTYRLTYDKKITELNEQQKWVNKNNGIIVEKNQIVGMCMEYKATLTTIDGQKIIQNGTICKE